MIAKQKAAISAIKGKVQESHPEIFGSHAEAPHGCEVLHRLVQGSEDICRFAYFLAVTKKLSLANAGAQVIPQLSNVWPATQGQGEKSGIAKLLLRGDTGPEGIQAPVLLVFW